MTDTIVGVDVELVIDPLRDFEPGCDSPNHGKVSWHGKDHEPATHYVVRPCCGSLTFSCPTWVNLDVDYRKCLFCGLVTPPRMWVFIPLGGVS